MSLSHESLLNNVTQDNKAKDLIVVIKVQQSRKIMKVK